MLFTSFFTPPPPLPPALHDHHSAVIISHNCCNTKNVIYMVQRNRCNLQYIGETKRRLKEHFLSHSNHSHTDMQLIQGVAFDR